VGCSRILNEWFNISRIFLPHRFMRILGGRFGVGFAQPRPIYICSIVKISVVGKIKSLDSSRLFRLLRGLRPWVCCDLTISPHPFVFLPQEALTTEFALFERCSPVGILRGSHRIELIDIKVIDSYSDVL
jgi:hypothetical protein